MGRLRRRFPHTAVLHFDPQGATAGADGTYAARLRGLDDDGLVARFVADVRGTEADQDELGLLRDALVHQVVTALTALEPKLAQTAASGQSPLATSPAPTGVAVTDDPEEPPVSSPAET